MDSEDELFDFDDDIEVKGPTAGKSGSFREEDQSSADTDFVAAWGPSDSPKSRFQSSATEDRPDANKQGDPAEQEAAMNGVMGTSMPISIPWTLKRKVTVPGEAMEQKQPLNVHTSTFIPPHKLSQANMSYMEGSVPEMGARPIRQRNEFLRKTGFLEASTAGFTVSRVGTGGPGPDEAADALPARPPRGSRGTNAVVNMDSSLSMALTPVTEL